MTLAKPPETSRNQFRFLDHRRATETTETTPYRERAEGFAPSPRAAQHSAPAALRFADAALRAPDAMQPRPQDSEQTASTTSTSPRQQITAAIIEQHRQRHTALNATELFEREKGGNRPLCCGNYIDIQRPQECSIAATPHAIRLARVTERVLQIVSTWMRHGTANASAAIRN